MSRSRSAVQIKGWVELEVRDKDGKLIKKHRQPMRSFVKNFMVYLAGLFSTPKTVTSSTAGASSYRAICTLASGIIDRNGNSVDLKVASGHYQAGADVPFGLLGVKAPEGEDSYGLLIGRGSTAPTPNDIDLENQYTNGSSLGQFAHGAVNVEEPLVSDNSVIVRITRTFTNNASEDQEVREIGLVARHAWLFGSGSGTQLNQTVDFLIARDVLTDPVVVPSGKTLTVRYIIQITT